MVIFGVVGGVVVRMLILLKDNHEWPFLSGSLLPQNIRSRRRGHRLQFRLRQSLQRRTSYRPQRTPQDMQYNLWLAVDHTKNQYRTWFHFSVTGLKRGSIVTFTIKNMQNQVPPLPYSQDY
jgi:hypothetical protein